MAELPRGPEDRRLDPEEFAHAVARHLASTPPKKRRAARRGASLLTLVGAAFGAGIALTVLMVLLAGGFAGRPTDEVLGVVVTTTTTEATTTSTAPSSTTTTRPTTTTTRPTTTTTSVATTTSTAPATTIPVGPSVLWIRCNGEPCATVYPRGPAISLTFQCVNASSCVAEFAYPGQDFKMIQSGDRMYTTFFRGEHRIMVTASGPNGEDAVMVVSFSTQ